MMDMISLEFGISTSRLKAKIRIQENDAHFLMWFTPHPPNLSNPPDKGILSSSAYAGLLSAFKDN